MLCPNPLLQQFQSILIPEPIRHPIHFDRYPICPILLNSEVSTMNPPPNPKSRSPHSTADSSETTIMALKQLSFFRQAAAVLALLTTGFVLGSLFGPPLSRQYGSRYTALYESPQPPANPGSINVTSSTSATPACTIGLPTSPSSTKLVATEPIAAEVAPANCAAQDWQQVKVQTLTGRFGATWWVAMTPDGSLLATVSGNVVEVRDVQTQQEVYVLKGHKDIIHAMSISPDGKTLATGSADKTIKLWDLETGQLIRTLVGHVGVLWSVAFTPDNQTLASGGGDSTIRLWDLRSGKLIRTLSGHHDRLFPVVFSPDGQILASGSKDKTIKLWNWKTGKELQTFTGHSDTVRTLVFSPDGTKLASAGWDGAVKIWDRQTGKELSSFTGDINHVVSVAFSPDGKTLASGGTDNTVKLWDVEQQALIATLSGHLDWVLAVTFSPDGRSLVSGGRDGSVALWQK